MKERFQSLIDDVKRQLQTLKDPQLIEKLEVEVFGRKGGFNALLKRLKDLPETDRRVVGQFANDAKNALKDLFHEALGQRPLKQEEAMDITEPGRAPQPGLGHVHPITTVREELADIFRSMNYEVFEGPELDTEWYVFEGLNIPPTHPARDIQDTFFVKRDGVKHRGHVDRWVMRTHTSNMQIHVLEERKPPVRAVAIGRIFRHEATDASHEHTFHQLEGFAVDDGISVANLIHTLTAMLGSFFRQSVKVRLRPGYFPFVEPGFELDCSCILCGGRGCSVCKRSGWLEMLGCGMIHPNVLSTMRVPEGMRGFAFGMGLDRLAMLRYGIDDIRLFHSGDLRFLNSF